MYEALYRNLDPLLGRFWQIDPVTTHNESPYVTMQNNPVSKFDWFGNYFTWANSQLEERYSELKEENNKKIGQYLGDLVQLLMSGNGGNKANKKINQLTTLVNMHADHNSQWSEMESSNVEFHVTNDKPLQPGAAGTAGYNNKDKRVDIKLGNEKGFDIMAHEFRHGYSFINGELVVGGNGLLDITDEVVAYNAGFLFLDKQTASLVGDGYYNVDWFKKTQLNTDTYRHLSGKEESLSLNIVGAVYLKYYNNDRIAHAININKGNANYTIKNAIDDLSASTQKNGKQSEFIYGSNLSNR